MKIHLLGFSFEREFYEPLSRAKCAGGETIGRIKMHNPIHSFNELFAQLGLPCDENSIRHFLAVHTPLAPDVDLPDAIFWTPSTATFLRESLLEDSDLAVVVDQLSGSLRSLEN